MIWNDGEIRLDRSSLKRHFWAQKGQFRQMVLTRGLGPQTPYSDDSEFKNGGLRLENIYFWDVYLDCIGNPIF